MSMPLESQQSCAWTFFFFFFFGSIMRHGSAAACTSSHKRPLAWRMACTMEMLLMMTATCSGVEPGTK